MAIKSLLFLQHTVIGMIGLGSLITLVGCDNSPSPKADTPTKPDTTGMTTYKVAVTGGTPPFSFLDDKGKPQGIDIDMMREIAKLEGFNVEFEPTSWNGMFEQVDKSRSDLAVSGISYKPERAEKYALSTSYFYNPAALLFLDNKPNLKHLADLKGLKIASNNGGKSQQYAESVVGGIPTKFDSPFLMFQSVVKGDSDVAIYDQPVWVNLAKNHVNQKLKIMPIESADDPKAQTVVLSSKNKAFIIDKVNDGIAKLKANGKLAEIEKKWTNETTGSTTVQTITVTSAPKS